MSKIKRLTKTEIIKKISEFQKEDSEDQLLQKTLENLAKK